MQSPTGPNQTRNLILCFDGTGNSYSNEVTNVVRIFSALEKEQRDRQLCYYQPGIGTYVSPTVALASTFRKGAELVDQAIAWYLEDHIMSGYRFLMNNFHSSATDKIILFGFSRGAYVSRCLAGMLHKVGLLPRDNEQQIQFAWEVYKDVSPGSHQRAKEFKAMFSTKVEIEFMGVWDTVASAGFFARHLPFTASNHIVKTFRQALALDERRARFKPNPWHRPSPVPHKDPNQGSSPTNQTQPDGPLSFIDRWRPNRRKHTTVFSDDSEAIDQMSSSESHKSPTDIKEVWFAGCHADVGGGSVPTDTTNSLANPSLHWMVKEVIARAGGVLFKKDAFKDMPAFNAVLTRRPHPMRATTVFPERTLPLPLDELTIPPSLSYADVLTASPRESIHQVLAITANPEKLTALRQDADDRRADALAPMYDQLRERPGWWILEFLPVYTHSQDAEGKWHKTFKWNRGRARVISTPDPVFHASVRVRQMELGYKPRAKFKGTPTYTE